MSAAFIGIEFWRKRAGEFCPFIIIVSLAFTIKKDSVKEERSIFHKPRVGFRENGYYFSENSSWKRLSY